jgi:pimeloyl-ACP methyl ester carboxylesterase
MLVPGIGPSAADTFGLVRSGLTAAHTLIAFDYPGAGDAPRTAAAPLDLDELADRLVAAADAAGRQRFAVAGNALGTAIAVRTALRHPSRVSALILTTPLAAPDARLLETIAAWRDLHIRGEQQELATFLTRVLLGTHATEALASDPFVLELAAAQFMHASPPGAAEQLDLLAALDIRTDLAALTVPTLAMITTQDAFIDPLAQRQAAAAIPGAKQFYLPTGHLALAEAPGYWLAHAIGFLARR